MYYPCGIRGETEAQSSCITCRDHFLLNLGSYNSAVLPLKQLLSFLISSNPHPKFLLLVISHLLRTGCWLDCVLNMKAFLSPSNSLSLLNTFRHCENEDPGLTLIL